MTLTKSQKKEIQKAKNIIANNTRSRAPTAPLVAQNAPRKARDWGLKGAKIGFKMGDISFGAGLDELKFTKAVKSVIKSTSENIGSVGRRTVERGRDLVAPVSVAADTAAGSVLANFILSPHISSTRLNVLSKIWQKYRFTARTRLVYEPAAGMLHNGQLTAFYDSDPTTTLIATGQDAINVAAAHKGALFQVAHQAVIPITMNIVDPRFTDQSISDPRQIYQGQFFILTATEFTEDLSCGTFWLDWEIEFFSEQVDGLASSSDDIFPYYNIQGVGGHTPALTYSAAWQDVPNPDSVSYTDLPGWVQDNYPSTFNIKLAKGIYLFSIGVQIIQGGDKLDYVRIRLSPTSGILTANSMFLANTCDDIATVASTTRMLTVTQSKLLVSEADGTVFKLEYILANSGNNGATFYSDGCYLQVQRMGPYVTQSLVGSLHHLQTRSLGYHKATPQEEYKEKQNVKDLSFFDPDEYVLVKRKL